MPELLGFLEYWTDQQVLKMQAGNNTTQENFLDPVFYSLHKNVRKKSVQHSPSYVLPFPTSPM